MHYCFAFDVAFVFSLPSIALLLSPISLQLISILSYGKQFLQQGQYVVYKIYTLAFTYTYPLEGIMV
jgi:hypothetical protein